MSLESEDRAMRRVVTGVNTDGKSCVIVDGPVRSFGPETLQFVWRTGQFPADNSGSKDIEAGQFDFDRVHSDSSTFLIMDFAPGIAPMWHATDTIDYCIVIDGEVTLELETGDVTLRAGDVAVDRGVVHSWRNDSGEPARCAFVMIPSLPVGQGRTV